MKPEWDRFLGKLVEPHTMPDTTALRAELTGKLDAAAGDMMRALIHFPDFQRLEAIWRALSFLVSRIETDETLEIFLIDVGKEELAADIRASEDLRNTGIYKLLVEKSVLTPGAFPWSLLVGMYTFEPNAPGSGNTRPAWQKSHTVQARRFSPVPVSAFWAALPCPGCRTRPAWPGLPPDIQAAWGWAETLAGCLPGWGLALPPRFSPATSLRKRTRTRPSGLILREMPETPRHDEYLWGNPAVVCACLIAKAFSRDEWQMRPGTYQDVERLALHLYKQAGESVAQPCAEVLLTERAALKILDSGLMPLVSFKDQDMARLVRFQSISQPATQLAGPWQDT